MGHLRSESNSAEVTLLLGAAVRTLRVLHEVLHDARSGSSFQELPRSFTGEAARRALRGALRDEGCWLSVMELQCLGGASRLQGGR